MNELRDLRKTIDKIDLKILELLKQRLTLSKDIGKIKNNLKLPIEDYERELVIRKKVREYARYINLEPQELDNLFLQIISVSKKVQGNNVKVAFLGPQGTFCEQAARRFFLHKPVVFVARPSIQDIFRSVEWDNYDYGVVPVENSIEGSVTITLDMFLETEVKICGEIQERIHHNLITKPQLTFDNIRTLISHPQAVAQCKKFIETNLPETKILEANSTAKAVQKVKQ